MAAPLYHLVPAGYFYSLPPDKPYVPQDFAREGFIHCTGQPEWVPVVANRLVAAVPGDFLVLTIDPDRVTSPIRWEPAAPQGAAAGESQGPAQYPHIYGALNRDAITDIRRMRRHPDGTFEPLDKSLPLHARERELFLTPKPGDERTRAWSVTIAPILRRFEQTQQMLDDVRGDVAERLARPLEPVALRSERDGKIQQLMANTLAYMAELDRQIEYFFARGTLAGYTPAPPAPAATPVAPAAPAEDELAQLRAAAESTLALLGEGTPDEATTCYLAALTLSAAIAGFFVRRGEEPPAPAAALLVLEARDPVLAGWARSALAASQPAEARKALEGALARIFGPAAEGGGSGPGEEGPELQPAPD